MIIPGAIIYRCQHCHLQFCCLPNSPKPERCPKCTSRTWYAAKISDPSVGQHITYDGLVCTCQRCGYIFARLSHADLPKCCPKCKSPYWQTPRTRILAAAHKVDPTTNDY